MVLMVALTGSADVPDGHRGRHGCRGGGCYGACYGGCYGGGYGGCYGGCYGGRVYSGGGCYGVATTGGGYGMPAYAYDSGTMPYVAVVPSGGTQTYQSGYYAPGTETPAASNGTTRATIIVHLPADASLTIDGNPTRSTSDTRTFVSPPLEPGKSYHYLLEAQVKRKGEKVNASRNVEVRAGRESQVYLDFPTSETPPRP